MMVPWSKWFHTHANCKWDPQCKWQTGRQILKLKPDRVRCVKRIYCQILEKRKYSSPEIWDRKLHHVHIYIHNGKTDILLKGPGYIFNIWMWKMSERAAIGWHFKYIENRYRSKQSYIQTRQWELYTLDRQEDGVLEIFKNTRNDNDIYENNW